MKKSILLLVLIMSVTVCGQMPDKLSKAEKVYGLSKFWQEVNYNFVYLNKVDRKAWEEEYIKLIPEVQDTKNDYQYYRLLSKFSAFIKDGHTNIYAYKEIWEQMNEEFTTHKLLLKGIDGKAIIISINQSKKDELPLIKIDIRLIASTKKNLLQLVKKGTFREDLYYRLNIFPINLLPLRERKQDTKIIFKHFIEKFSENRKLPISEDVFDRLFKYNWPGELKNIAERMAILASDDKVIGLKHIPMEIKNDSLSAIQNIIGAKPLEETFSEIEIASINFAQKANQNKSKAAEILGIPTSTLRTKMLKHNI